AATSSAPSKTARPTFSAAELDRLLAPIDLYSDALLWQIFRAATHPYDVVKAARWLQEPEHARLGSEDLARAAQALPWEPSVKALVSVPRVLLTMSDHLDWMQRLSTVFMTEPGALTEAIQRLRRRAQEAGTLEWMPYQINGVAGTITIGPTP